ncbi:uncharacterized protein THITE_28217, partial [Thermothielavioides terrestris NRRL 8126]
SLTHLRADMRWWFTTSDHQVKIVILVHLDRLQHTIIIERWEEEVPDRGAPLTRRREHLIAEGRLLEPVNQQKIVITGDGSMDPASYNV